MSTSTATRTQPTRRQPQIAPARRAARPSRARALRRRLGFLAAVAVAALVVAAAVAPWADKAVQEVKLPLRHEDIIRQQAVDKGLDPALIAGVIYAESHFRDQTSHAGAKGLMQLMPETADYIAQKSGGTAFEQGDLATPQVNISYGSWYLRYLLEKYDGSRGPRARCVQRGRGQGRRVGRRRERAAASSSAPPTTSRSPRRASTWRRCSTRAWSTGARTARELGL